MLLSPVDKGANRVDVRPNQVDQSARKVEEHLSQEIDTASCPRYARDRGAACLANLPRSEAAWLAAQKPVCLLVLLLAPA